VRFIKVPFLVPPPTNMHSSGFFYPMDSSTGLLREGKLRRDCTAEFLNSNPQMWCVSAKWSGLDFEVNMVDFERCNCGVHLPA
jgi:hypothetical protein